MKATDLVPPSLQAVVDRALAKLPGDRFQSGAELAAALETVGAELILGQVSGTPPGGRPETDVAETGTAPIARRNLALLEAGPAALPASGRSPRGWRTLVLAAILVIVGVMAGRSLEPRWLDFGWPTKAPSPGFEGAPTGPAETSTVAAALEAEPVEEDPVTVKELGWAASVGDEASIKVPAEATEETVNLPQPALLEGELPPPEGAHQAEHAEHTPEAVTPLEPEVAAAPETEGAGAREMAEDSLPSVTETVAGEVEPPPVAANVAPPRPRPMTHLEIVYENRLKLAYLSVWIDSARKLSVRLELKGLLHRIKGREHRWTIPVPSGKHSVEVHISGISRDLEAHRKVYDVFSTADRKQLRVQLRPGSSDLRLLWEGLER